MDNIYQQRIEELRRLMRGKGWDAVIITGSDPHGSEYPAERWKQVQWFTGFTGEAGDVVVTLDHAGLWTDTRYFIQATAQLAGTGVELHKTRIPGQVLIPEWLDTRFDEDAIIAVDGLCLTCGAAADLPQRFSLVSVPDLADTLWTDRPQVPCTPIFTVERDESRLQKIEWLRRTVEEKGCDSILLTGLDEIAWILNVRGSDIDYNPLVISYLLVGPDSAKWFVHDGCPAEVSADGIEILPYSDIEMYLSDADELGRLMADPDTLNYHLLSTLQSAGADLLLESSPVGPRKSVKSAFEIEGMRRAHFIDGIAMEKFLFWLDNSVENGVSERDAADKLAQLRAGLKGYHGDSFETISAYGKGAALPHYVTPAENAPMIQTKGLYLCDSGGQFDCGTTDITRTIPVGECTGLEKEDYTLVLKGHIDLAMAVFPEGTPGCRLDALARGPLWQARRNFGHGTGHGVGCFLGVHEGPQDIRQNLNATPLLPGMITSDEPGIYREGMHGVRHENLLLCVEEESNEFGRWLKFETLTLCHFDTAAILPQLLTKEEKDWLNSYNAKVYDTLSPHLDADIAQWLREKTMPLD